MTFINRLNLTAIPILTLFLVSASAALTIISSANALADNSKTSNSTMLTSAPTLPNLPNYPNAKMEKGWRTILGADSMNVILVTKDLRTKVIEWYRSTLEANGWKIASGNERDMRLAARNDKREYVNISTTETADKSCRIAVILIKN